MDHPDDIGNVKEALKPLLPPHAFAQLEDRDSGEKLATSLPAIFSPQMVSTEDNPKRAWELCGRFFMVQGRFHEALRIYRLLYDHMLKFQDENQKRVNKGMPLVWISDCHWALRRPVIARRFGVLTLIEDAIELSGGVSPDRTGSYFRLAWTMGIPHEMLERYSRKAFDLYKNDKEYGYFPEWIIQQLDQDWMLGYPTKQEIDLYPVNRLYVKFLLKKFGEGTGKSLELLAEYLMSVMPGCRTYRRAKSGSTDYDIVCAMEGSETDFRAEFGRYFVCECKDWSKPADFSAFAKFCRVLDSVKSKFGILFSRSGISGEGRKSDAVLEQIKVFQDRGIIIIVINEEDIAEIANNDKSFISMLRYKYEKVRLDLLR